MNFFIIGSGFTKAIFPDSPLNNNLLKELINRFPKSAAQTLIDRYKIQNIEIALTRLDAEISTLQSRSEKRISEIQNLRRNIENELADFFQSFQVTENLIIQNEWVNHFINGAFKSGDVAISLNYDCVLEGILDCLGKWTPKGGYGYPFDNPNAYSDTTPKSPVTVLKIHGSVNFVIAPYLDKPTAKAVNFIFDKYFFPNSARDSHFGFGAGTGETYLIAPSFVKIPTVEITYLMLDALAATNTAINLIVVGCSLRPEDGFLTVLITNFLRQPSWRKRKIIIIDPAAGAIKKHLENYWGVKVSDQILPIEAFIQSAVEQVLTVL